MENRDKHPKQDSPISNDISKENFPGYPTYPASEDIYNQYEKEEEIDPEDVTQKKAPVERIPEGMQNIKDFEDDITGEDLDIPGTEYDDQQEQIGSEDEENNNYSIGGDNHESSEENQGDDYSSSRT